MGLSMSHCPLCRAVFKHFAAVCEPLAAYIQTQFPVDAAAREEQIAKLERDEWHAEAPRLRLPNDAGTPTSFSCVGCQNVAAPPAVLPCGHVVCARPAGWLMCPVAGCVGVTQENNGVLAVCGIVDTILQVDYQSVPCHPDGVTSHKSHHLASPCTTPHHIVSLGIDSHPVPFHTIPPRSISTGHVSPRSICSTPWLLHNYCMITA